MPGGIRGDHLIRCFVMKATQLPLIHIPQHSGDHPQIVHPYRMRFIQQTQHEPVPIDRIVCRFAGFQGHSFACSIKYFLQMQGNFSVPLSGAQPFFDLFFTPCTQKPAVTGQSIPQVASIVYRAVWGIGQIVRDEQITLITAKQLFKLFLAF